MQASPPEPIRGAADAATPLVMPMTFLRLGDVMRVTGLGRSTVYRLMAERRFPPPCRLGLRAVGWRSADISQWSAARPVARR
jgi:prophage regulatory protein